MYRLFIAVELPYHIKKRVDSICFGLRDARWVKNEQMHITLRFIGEVDGAMFRRISDSLTGVKSESFALSLKGVGHFPPRRAPQVLWLGIEPTDPLRLLKKRIDSALNNTGVTPERRKFAPHLTIARFRHSPKINQITEYMARNSLFETPSFETDSFHLFSSLLTPKGAIHQIEATYPLSGIGADHH